MLRRLIRFKALLVLLKFLQSINKKENNTNIYKLYILVIIQFFKNNININKNSNNHFQYYY
jgi:hypothetical protein